MQKHDATLEELKDFIKQQTLDFTEEDKKVIDNTINLIKENCKKYGYSLPPINNIVFAKTTMHEENDSYAYTHGTQIYIGEYLLNLVHEEEDEEEFFRHAISHEIFHCLTRNNPDFRKDMYKMLGFNIVDKDFDFPKKVSDRIINNPDVENYDYYSIFDINGEKKNCTVVFSYSKPFENEGDSFFDNNVINLIPIDDLNTIYTENDASNFSEIFEETGYGNIVPEEIMADNFGITINGGIDTDESNKVVENIDTYLKSYKPSTSNSNNNENSETSGAQTFKFSSIQNIVASLLLAMTWWIYILY